MRRSAVLFLKLQHSNFIYKKVTKGNVESSLVTSVVGCAQVFAIKEKRRLELEEQFIIDTPFQITLIPSFEYAFPSYWRAVERVADAHQLDGVGCEGTQKEYTRRPDIWVTDTERVGDMWRLERWRKQRAPFPWAWPYPTKNIGVDNVTYTRMQRLFPHRIDYGTEEDKRIRARHAYDRLLELTPSYSLAITGFVFHHSLCPYIAEILFEEGYKTTVKVELEAGSSANELYAPTMRHLLNEATKAL